MMFSETVNLNTRSHNYDPPTAKKDDDASTDKTSASTPPPTNGLHIEKPILDVILWPPKSTLLKSFINPNTCGA